ncbi:MAG: NTP transferase domain-containing protein [Erythrobacter sp.]|jgi:choline kinase|nr:NTP transferase domain-containing protein [Erythrobacter sp.]
METLIIAAGYGTRLAPVSGSKPLAPVCGIPLIEIGIRQAMAAGSDSIIVVTGHEAEALETALAAIGQRLRVSIRCVRLADWSRPNGYSVLAGAELIEGDFLLVMADHILSTPILAGLARCGAPDRGVTLAIDRRVDSPLVDPDDATWVRLDSHQRISAIGKHVAPYDAVDCGAFLATRELPAAIAEAISEGLAGSLSDGMQRLADRGRAAVLDIGDAWWIDVDDPRAHALAEAQAPLHLPALFAGEEVAR